MDDAIPDKELFNKILAQLATTVPSINPGDVITSLAILKFSNHCVASYEAHFARYGLSQGRFAVLMLLFHFPERLWTPGLLAELAGVRRATMTGLLDVLEKGKWIKRRKNPSDRRSSEIFLTEPGHIRFQNILPDHFSRLGKAMHGLTQDQHQRMIELMNKFSGHIAALAQPDNSKPPTKG